jgi:hypothetical protein
MQKFAMVRSDSLNVSVTLGDELKRAQSEVEHLKRTLAQSQYTIAELRVALAEAQERCDDMGRELAERAMHELPGIGGALSMMANLDGVSLDLKQPGGAPSRPGSRLHRFATPGSTLSADALRQEVLCRWPDLRDERVLPIPARAAQSAETQAVPAARKQAASAVKSSLLQLLAQAREGGPLGALRTGLLALVAFVVVLRLLIHLVSSLT